MSALTEETALKLIEVVEKLNVTLSRVTERDMSVTVTRDIRLKEQARLRKQRERLRAKERDMSRVTSVTSATLSKKNKTLEGSKEGKIITTTASAREDLFETPSSWPVPAPPEPKPKKIGCRVPEDFFPEPEDCDIGVDRGMTLKDVEEEHHKFMDYWRARPGKEGLKLDWHATFRNWLRRASDDYPKKLPDKQQGNSNGHYRR